MPATSSSRWTQRRQTFCFEDDTDKLADAQCRFILYPKSGTRARALRCRNQSKEHGRWSLTQL
eukprot:1633491-Karenia_brevis.AAC.1